MDFTCHADLLLFVCKVCRGHLTEQWNTHAHTHTHKHTHTDSALKHCNLFRFSLGLPAPPDPQSTCVRWCLSSRWNVSSSCLWGLNSTGGTFPGGVHGLSIPSHVCYKTSSRVGPTFNFVLVIFVHPNFDKMILSNSCLILHPPTEMVFCVIECACLPRWTVVFCVFGCDGGGGGGGARSFICLSSTWFWWFSEPAHTYRPGRKHRWGPGAWYYRR